jgi:hypothetical protein
VALLPTIYTKSLGNSFGSRKKNYFQTPIHIYIKKYLFNDFKNLSALLHNIYSSESIMFDD